MGVRMNFPLYEYSVDLALFIEEKKKAFLSAHALQCRVLRKASDSIDNDLYQHNILFRCLICLSLCHDHSLNEYSPIISFVL